MHPPLSNLSARRCAASRRPAARILAFLILYACLGGGFAFCLPATEPSSFQLRPAAQADSTGVFLDQLVQSDQPLCPLRLCDAPAFGRVTVLTRARVEELLREAGAGLAVTNWTGAEAVRVSRRTRAFTESDLLILLTATLQQEYVKDKGELELRSTRPWTELNLPAEPLALKILELPTAGVTPAFIVRFELRTAREGLGVWQTSVQARVWREVWVARSALKRGDPLSDVDVARERRDVLAVREAPAEFTSGDPMLELAESVPAGAPLLARSLRLRPVVHRGQTVLALLQDGALSITMKVEVLQDGAPGQIVRARNPVSRRDMVGRVFNEQTILITL
jgi:flagella basal body P-ring formation protein FlgA